MSNSRAVAAIIIEEVCYQNVSLSEAFLNPELKPHADDLGFIKEICFGTLRFWIQLQALLKDLLETPIKQEDKDLECLLCVGLYQLLYMHVPEYALVNETVSATRVFQKAWASGLVNKILRMAIDKKNNGVLITRGITAEFSHPNWIIEKTQLAWPDDWKNILAANNQKAPLFLRVNKTKITIDNFEKLLTENDILFERVDDLPHALLLPNPLSVEKIPGFYEGLFSVQDASGQKVITYLDLKSNQTILDACAAPGSKTTHILETCRDIKKLVAVDIYKSRLEKISDNLKRLQLPSKNTTLIAADVCETREWWDGELFDRILVDAPCSATGVIRRHPDIKILRKKADIKNLAEQQLFMLESLWPLLQPSGKLIYTTCSIFPDENEGVIGKFLSLHDDAKIIPIDTNWGLNLTYGQQVLTGDKNRDGFYYAVIEKV